MNSIQFYYLISEMDFEHRACLTNHFLIFPFFPIEMLSDTVLFGKAVISLHQQRELPFQQSDKNQIDLKKSIPS